MNDSLLPTVEISREKTGAIFLCQSRRDAPLVFVRLQHPGGAILEPQTQAGLADLACEWWEEGPAGVKPSDWHRRAEAIAADVGFNVNSTHWSAETDCLTEHADETQAMLLEMLRAPGLPTAEWPQLVKRRRASAKEEWAQPNQVIGRLAAVQYYGYAHPYAHQTFEKSLHAARAEDAVALVRSAFGHYEGQIYGIVGGDVDAEKGFRLLRELADVRSGKRTHPLPSPVPLPARERTWLMDHRKVDQAFFRLQRGAFKSGEPRRVALRLADYILGGGGFSSRLMERVRSQFGHTYGISSRCPEREFASPFSIASFTRAENLGAMLTLIGSVLREVVEQGFTAEERAAAAEHLYGSLPLQLLSPKQVLGFTLGGLRAGLSPKDLENDWRQIKETSLAEVNEAARCLIGDGVFQLAVIGPAKQLRPQLDAWDEIAVFPYSARPDRWPK